MAGELRCKAIRYKTALPLIQGGSATAGPMCAERCPRDYVCEPAVPNFKAHPVVGHKENVSPSSAISILISRRN